MHVPVVLLDATSKGAINYLNLAHEFLKRNNDPVKIKVPETVK
jgi:chromosome partitioning protein